MRTKINTADRTGNYTLSWYIGNDDADLYLELRDNTTGELKTMKLSEIDSLDPELKATALSLLKLMVRVDMALLPWLYYKGYDKYLDAIGVYERP
jgi:hypothetical protein